MPNDETVAVTTKVLKHEKTISSLVNKKILWVCVCKIMFPNSIICSSQQLFHYFKFIPLFWPKQQFFVIYMNYEYLGTTKKNMDVPHFVCWPCPRENKRFDFQRTNKINQEDVGKHVGRGPFRPMLHPNDNPPKKFCTFGRTKPENLAEYEHDKLYCWYDHREQNDQKCSNFGSSFPKQMSKTICGLRANWMTSFWFHDLPVTNDVNDNAEAEDWIDQSRNQQQVACQQK